MPVSNEKYDPVKIDRLRHYLEDMALQSQPKPYEVFVDNLRVVPKTEDPKDFDKYEYYMNEDTGKIRILIYNSSLSPRNDQYCFYMPGKGASLNGLGEIDSIISEKLAAQEREFKLGKLQTELEQTKKELGEAEEYITTLEKDLEQSKSNKYKIGKLDLVELGSVVLENIAMKNSGALQKIGLGGLGSMNHAESEEDEVTEVNYSKKKEQQQPKVSDEQLRYLPLLQHLDRIFNQKDLVLMMSVLEKFSEDPQQLKIVAELLNLKSE